MCKKRRSRGGITPTNRWPDLFSLYKVELSPCSNFLIFSVFFLLVPTGNQEVQKKKIFAVCFSQLDLSQLWWNIPSNKDKPFWSPQPILSNHSVSQHPQSPTSVSLSGSACFSLWHLYLVPISPRWRQVRTKTVLSALTITIPFQWRFSFTFFLSTHFLQFNRVFSKTVTLTTNSSPTWQCE